MSYILIYPVGVLIYSKIATMENNYFQGLSIPINLLLKKKPRIAPVGAGTGM